MNCDELLPEVYNKKELKRKYDPLCWICKWEFKKIGAANHQFHCKRCANSVCKNCSDNRIPLSKTDKINLYRVCDMCVTELQHFKLKKKFADVVEDLKAKEEIIEMQLDSTMKGKESLTKEILLTQKDNSINQTGLKKRLIKLKE